MAEKRERFIVIDEGLDFMVRDTVTGDELIDADGVADVLNDYEKENEQLKQSIKEIDDAELHLKQIILKRIDDYIWEWEDEGTPVAQVLRELQDEIKGDVE